MENELTGDGSAAKKSSLVSMIAGVAILTVLGAGGGWMLGGMVAPTQSSVDIAAGQINPADGQMRDPVEGATPISTEANGVVLLAPITTNLAFPSDNWVRLEVALLFKGAPEVALAEDIHQDILAYMRTMSLQQLEGPRGFQYLRDDLQERVDLRSQGQVSKIMFRTFVIE